VVLAVAACEEMAGPTVTTDSGVTVPDVAGTYAGEIIIDLTFTEGGETTTLPQQRYEITVEVEQDGDAVSLSSARLVLGGPNPGVEAGTNFTMPGTIDGDGVWTPGDRGYLFDFGLGAACTNHRKTNTVSFSGNRLTLTSRGTSSCSTLNYDAALTR